MSAWPSPRVTVFVSSTIGECAAERDAAREAIVAIKCEPVLFESIGARPHPARITYLEGLSRSQICVIIWKEGYGWIDPALDISGLEDEFRISRDRQLDLLVYIKSDAPNRDPRLAGLIDKARTFVTTHSYENEADLRDQISADITSLLSSAYIDRTSRKSERLIDPSAVLTGTMPAGMTAVERPELERRINESTALNLQTWVVGAPGAGKTILLAQWAVRNGATYVNARGLSLRHLLHSIAAALNKAVTVSEPISVEDAADTLRSAWRQNASWPLVIDDPPSLPELLRILADLGDADGKVRIIFGARLAPEAGTLNQIVVPGLSSGEAAELISRLPNSIRDNVSAATDTAKSVLPLAIRKVAAARSAPGYMVFDDVEGVTPNPKTREVLAFIAASPEPLTLEDLSILSSTDEGIVELDAHLAALSFLLVDDGLGFRLVHEEIAKDLQESLARRPALRKLVFLRLAQFFEKSKRYLPAFELYQAFDAMRALRTAYRAALQASMEGRYALALVPLQFTAAAKRKAGERIDLVVSLIALAQAQEMVGETTASNATIAEADQIAKDVGDTVLLQIVEDQKLIRRAHRDLKPEDLNALRNLQARYKADGRVYDSARLAIEEGAILISVGEYEKSIPVLREAREDFRKVGDRYGVYIATRNLIASLNMSDGTQREAEALLKSFDAERQNTNQLRERAWMCNILARRYRLDKQLNDAVAVAKEAIEIGGELGDPYVVALNRIALGNALREKGDLDAALESFKQSGKEAQAISRKEIDGLASRLASSVLLQKVEGSAPYLHPKLYSEAEAFATYVIGLLSGSIAEYQAAEAYDCRGDARWGLGRKADARLDWASSVKMFLELDQDRAMALLHSLALNLDIESEPEEAMRVMLSALPDVTTPQDNKPWTLLLKLIEESIMKGHPQGVGVYTVVALKISQQITSVEQEVGLWLRLLALALEDRKPPDDGRMSFVLSAFLAHTRQRNLSVTQLTAMTELTVGQSKAVHFHSVNEHLQTSLKIGPDNNVLIVLDDLDGTPATRFLLTALTCFFAGFREDINREFLLVPLESGLYIRCSIVDVSKAPEDIQRVLGTPSESPVSIAMFDPRSGRAHDMFITCRPDLQECCQGDTMKATELQFMYADVLRALLTMALGGKIEAEVLRPKIVSLIRKTIQ